MWTTDYGREGLSLNFFFFNFYFIFWSKFWVCFYCAMTWRNMIGRRLTRAHYWMSDFWFFEIRERERRGIEMSGNNSGFADSPRFGNVSLIKFIIYLFLFFFFLFGQKIYLYFESRQKYFV